MNNVILVRYEEIFLKGLNRSFFEDRLIKNMKRVLYGLGPVKITKSQSRIYVEPEKEGYPVDDAIKRLCRVFGIASVSPVCKIETVKETIYEKSIEMTELILQRYPHKTFKVETKRAEGPAELKKVVQRDDIMKEGKSYATQGIKNLSI